MNRDITKLTVVVFTAFIMLITCGLSPTYASAQYDDSGPDELDIAIRDASNYLNSNITAGSKIVILNVQSDSAALSDYIIDELITNAVNDRIFEVVDRMQLDLIRAEQDFQWAGEVDDNRALEVGRFLEAHIIVSGRVSQVGDRYRMVIRALEVQTARVQGQYNRNIAAGPTINALWNDRSGNSRTAYPSSDRGSGGTVISGGRDSPSAPPNTPGGTGSTSAVIIVPEITTTLNVTNTATWNTAINRIRNGGNDQTYILNVIGNVTVPVPLNNENIFGNITGLTVTIQGGGTLAMANVNGSLLRIGSRQTVIARDITLRGRSDNNSAVVTIERGGTFRLESGATVTGNTIGYWGGTGGVNVNGGTFILDGGSVTGNTANSRTLGIFSGGVSVTNSGTFIMESGYVTGNTTLGFDDGSGGVYIRGGTFFMKGGTISNNTYSGNSNSTGGGVYIYEGTFNMEGGTIMTNTNNGRGAGGVYIDRRATFRKTGGTIYGNDESRNENTTASAQGHALYLNSSPARWRNATAGPDDNTDGYGFWMND